MTNEATYLLGTLAVAAPLSSIIGYIVYNLEMKVRRAHTMLAWRNDHIAKLEVNLSAVTNELESERKAAAEAKTPLSNIKNIDVDFGTTVDASPTLLISYDDSTAVVPLVTEKQVKAIVSEMVTDGILKAAPIITAQATKKMTRRGAL